MGTSNLGFNTPFPFSRGYSKHIMALRKRRREGGGNAIVLLPSTLPSNLLCFSFYVLCRVDRHLAMDARDL
jgi:hypothetical protein